MFNQFVKMGPRQLSFRLVLQRSHLYSKKIYKETEKIVNELDNEIHIVFVWKVYKLQCLQVFLWLR